MMVARKPLLLKNGFLLTAGTLLGFSYLCVVSAVAGVVCGIWAAAQYGDAASGSSSARARSWRNIMKLVAGNTRRNDFEFEVLFGLYQYALAIGLFERANRFNLGLTFALLVVAVVRLGHCNGVFQFPFIALVLDIIAATAQFIEQKFADEGSGHDWAHIRRVWLMARRLALGAPEADRDVTELAALLHDIADWKFHNGDYEAGPRAAREWLSSQGAAEGLIQRVEVIIREVSFKGLGVETPVSSVEAALVQDADRLDAIGAIGIARAFAYGGHKGRPLHDPAIAPVAHDSFASYQVNTAPTLNHFYEKLLHLKDRLHTPMARQIAQERHAFMEVYVARFLTEWDGID